MSGLITFLGTLLIVVGVLLLIIGPFIVGGYLARRLRMPDHGWKIGVILLTLVNGILIVTLMWPPKLGIDLSGGLILVYEVDQSKKQEKRTMTSQEMDNLVGAVSERLDRGGQEQITVRRYGVEQIEVIVPEVESDQEAERIKNRVSRAGTLEFRILADKDVAAHDELIKLGGALDLDQNEVVDKEGNVLGWWRPVRPGEEESFSGRGYGGIQRRIRTKGDQQITEILVVKDRYDVTGGYLSAALPSRDQKTGNPSVDFRFNSTGARKFGGLTGSHLPDKVQDFTYKLGIILEGELYSAPSIQSTIHDRGEITGSFDQKEVDELVQVLNAGSLPTALREEPIHEMKIGATLGRDTIRRGSLAIGISMVMVLVFMLFYYRFSGVIACLALLSNLVLILAVMISIKAAFTLPGLAGLVLTVGMAVDANVLIFERIREELARGAALRMAIRNGFARATTAIVDANLTTLITATVLYVIGTEQVKGFAVTLWLGVVMSMFTAIFCSRVVFDIAERRRWISELKMLRLLGSTQINFLSKRRLAAIASACVILIGMVGVVFRGKDLLDIDFTGGVSVTIAFQEPGYRTADIRAALQDELPDLTVSDVKGDMASQWFVINTSEGDPDDTVRRREAVSALGRQLDQFLSTGNEDPKRKAAVAAVDKGVDAIDAALKAEQDPEAGIPAVKQQIAEIFAGELNEEQIASVVAVVDQHLGRIAREREAIDVVFRKIHDAFPGQLAANMVTIAGLEQIPGESAPGAIGQLRQRPLDESVPAMIHPAAMMLAQVAPGQTDSSMDDAPSENTPETPADPPAEPAEPTAEPPAEPTAEPPAEPTAGPPAEPTAEPQAEPTPEPATRDPFAGGTTVTLSFSHGIDHDSLEEMIDRRLEASGIRSKTVNKKLTSERYRPGDVASHPEWDVSIALPPDQAQPVLEGVKAELEDTPYFPSSNTIGSTVAGKMQGLAMVALVASLLCIIGYIWIRFQRVVFGLAAVVALVHDVLVTLGIIALSAYVADYLGFLMIDEFKIGLPVLAAFLTIIGYSLNDTIVVFDRIREVRGKAPRLTEEMVNNSINQTLSRTLLTSLTTLIVVVILYFGGGHGIHAFAFALVIGVIVGTYSSIFVASPILIWMSQPSGSK